MPEKSYEFIQLSSVPELADETNLLIEKSFGYQVPFHFNVDFAPLAGIHNLHNRHILVDRDSREVVAHLGACVRTFCWGAETMPVTLLGGIAVDERLRGQGLFTRMLADVIARYESQSVFFLLWSDKHDMYEKYGFHLGGRQWCYQVLGNEPRGQLMTLAGLNEKQHAWMRELYRTTVNRQSFSPLRDTDDWRHIAGITSAQLRFTGEENQPNGYYFLGKGMDLGGIVHDWAHQEGLAGLLRDSGSPGMVWAAHNVPVDDHVRQDLQQVGLWRPTHHPMALQKLSSLLDGASVTWTAPHFHVQSARGNWKLLAHELLDEIFSYGPHGVRAQGVPVWVGGLDSV